MLAYDNATHSAFKNSTTNTQAHTCSGSDRVLMVYVYAGSDVVTGVTYNGVSMTFVQKQLMGGAAAGQYIYEYILAAPASGSNNVVVTSSANLGGYISAVSYTGAKQTGQPDNSAKQALTGVTTITTNLTTVADNCWLVGYAYHNGTVVAGTATTLRGGSVNVLQTMDSNGAKTPAGSYGLNTTRSPADFAGHVIASIAPVVSGSAYTQDVEEQATAADNLIKDTSKPIEEATTGNDTIIKGKASRYTENVNVTASSDTLLVKLATLLENVNITETFTRAMTKAYAEAVGVADTIRKETTKLFSEVVEITASATALTATYVQILLETVTAGDSISRLVGYVRSFTELVTTNDYFRIALNGINALWSDLYSDTADAWQDLYTDTTDAWSDKYIDN